MNIKKYALLMVALLLSTNVYAQVYIPPSPNQFRGGTQGEGHDIVAVVETDKLVYAPGETVHVVVYIENASGTTGFNRLPSQDFYKNQLLRLHSDPELSGGGKYFGDITPLPVKANWGIGPRNKRAYLAYSFKLVDANTRRALPKGYYAIGAMPLAFKAWDSNVVHHSIGDSKVIFISDTNNNGSIH